MTYVINDPCIGTKDNVVRRRLPGRLHPPTPDERGFHAAEQLYIDPDRLRRLRRGLPRRRDHIRGAVTPEWESLIALNAAHYQEKQP